jgi:hypothetical protein
MRPPGLAKTWPVNLKLALQDLYTQVTARVCINRTYCDRISKGREFRKEGRRRAMISKCPIWDGLVGLRSRVSAGLSALQYKSESGRGPVR